MLDWTITTRARASGAVESVVQVQVLSRSRPGLLRTGDMYARRPDVDSDRQTGWLNSRWVMWRVAVLYYCAAAAAWRGLFVSLNDSDGPSSRRGRWMDGFKLLVFVLFHVVEGEGAIEVEVDRCEGAVVMGRDMHRILW